MFADVVIPRTRLDALTYLVPDALCGKVQVGSAVKVELRRRPVPGIVLALNETSAVTDPKPILELVEPEYCPPNLLQFMTWVSRYYLASWGETLSLALPARILANAEKAGLTELLVPCAACYSRLTVTRHELAEDEALRQRISGIIEVDYKGSLQIMNIIQFLEKYVMNEIAGKIKAPFKHKVACYYGCLLVRPHQILKFDRPEDPQTMDNLMKKVGATPIDWAFKVECCGAGFSVSRTDTVSRLCGQILDDAVSKGAEAIVVACPMCHSNLDMRRPAIEKYMGKTYPIPVVYLTQVLGISLGIPWKKLGLHRHMVPVNLPSNGKQVPAAPASQKTAPMEE